MDQTTAHNLRDEGFASAEDVATRVLYRGISSQLHNRQIHTLVEWLIFDLTPNQRRSLANKLEVSGDRS